LQDGREIIKQHFTNGWETAMGGRKKNERKRKRKKSVGGSWGPADDLLYPTERHIFLVVESAKIKKKKTKKKKQIRTAGSLF
jgi:hypothetical protein